MSLPPSQRTIGPLNVKLISGRDIYDPLLYDWRESCFLIGSICLDKSPCLPENIFTNR